MTGILVMMSENKQCDNHTNAWTQLDKGKECVQGVNSGGRVGCYLPRCSQGSYDNGWICWGEKV